MMHNTAIYLPMLATMSLTAVVWFYMYARRIPAMRKAGVSVQTYTTPDRITEYLPEKVNLASNNLKNLFELPTLYYGLCLYLFVSGNVAEALSLWFMLGRALIAELSVYLQN